jgi:hypothetical protein
MLSSASGQVGFFDAAELVGPLPGRSFFALLAGHGHRIVRDVDFAKCYSADRGRPSIPPSLLAKVVLLEYRTGCSDEQAMEHIAWDLRWKIALGLPVDHRGFHPTTLTKFRARLLLRGKERLALENTVELAGELGLLEGRSSRSSTRRRCSAPPRRRTPCDWSVTVCASCSMPWPRLTVGGAPRWIGRWSSTMRGRAIGRDLRLTRVRVRARSGPSVRTGAWTTPHLASTCVAARCGDTVWDTWPAPRSVDPRCNGFLIRCHPDSRPHSSPSYSSRTS